MPNSKIPPTTKLVVLEKDSPPLTPISTADLAECVAIENEVRLLQKLWRAKRARIRKLLASGAEIEDGPLSSFARRISRGGL